MATRPVAERLVALLAPRPGELVLELAAGIGETGFLVAPFLAPGGRLRSTDVAPEMVDAARRRAAALGLTNVEHGVADMTALPYDDASVDGILCRFGVMLVGDAARAAEEMTRVLRPGGRVALAVWASADDNPWISATGRAALELGLIERPPQDEPGPFRFARPERLAALLEGAGLEVETVEDVPIEWHADSLEEWWETVTDTSRMLSALLARLDDSQVAGLRRAAEKRLAPYVKADGRVVGPGLARAALAGRPG